MRFFETLMASPPSTPLSRYTAWNGALYVAMGLGLFAWPGQVQLLFRAAPFEAGESGLVRLVGVVLAIIGWFYVMGARTRADSFSLATVVDRAALPLFLVPLAVTGAVDPHIALPFSILDPLLALGAFVIWRRQRAT